MFIDTGGEESHEKTYNGNLCKNLLRRRWQWPERCLSCRTRQGNGRAESAVPEKEFCAQRTAYRGQISTGKFHGSISLAAEQRYGIELDVQLSKDGEVVVFHDATLNRVCGVDSRVDAKNYAELKTLGLAGSDQTIPLFSEVLKCIDGRGPLLVELKTGPKNRELCRKTMDLLSKYEGQYCIESFDPRIVMWFRFHAPKVFRGQLACRPRDYEPEDASRPVAFILGNCLMDFLGRPQFIS